MGSRAVSAADVTTKEQRKGVLQNRVCSTLSLCHSNLFYFETVLNRRFVLYTIQK